MEFYKLNSSRKKNVNISKYLVDWNADCRSKIQKKVKLEFKGLWPLDLWLEEFPVTGSRMTVDLINITKGLAIEIQGEQHEEYNPHFHKGNIFNFVSQLKRDDDKRKWCEKNNLVYCEIFATDLPITLKLFKDRYDLEF